MHVIPAPGVQVPDPDRGAILAPHGREVEPSQYWQRRLLDGDVVLAPMPATAPVPPAAPHARSPSAHKSRIPATLANPE